MKILVTGATGLFGRALCEKLSAQGDHVVAMARREPARSLAAAEFRAGDVRDLTAVTEAMRGCTAVAHLAWAFLPLETAESTWELDVGGTRNVVEAMKTTGCRKVVFSSSVLSYGAIYREGRLLSEDDPQRPTPDHLYGRHKAEAEEVLFSSGVDAVSVRAGVTASRSMYDNTVYASFAGPAVMSCSDGDIGWQLVHQEDVARFFALALHNNRTGPVNLAASGVVPWTELAEILGRRLVTLKTGSLERSLNVAQRLGLINFSSSEARSIAYMPKVNTARLNEEWGFECAWTSRQVAEDVSRGAYGYRALLSWKDLRLPGHIPLPRVNRARAEEDTGSGGLPALSRQLQRTIRQAAAREIESLREGPALRRETYRRSAEWRYGTEIARLGSLEQQERVTESDARQLGDPQLDAQLGLLFDRVVHAGAAHALGSALRHRNERRSGDQMDAVTAWPMPDHAEAILDLAAAQPLTGAPAGGSANGGAGNKLVAAHARAFEVVGQYLSSLSVLVAERGRRLAEMGTITRAEGSFQMSLEELRDPPEDAPERLARRATT